MWSLSAGAWGQPVPGQSELISSPLTLSQEPPPPSQHHVGSHQGFCESPSLTPSLASTPPLPWHPLPNTSVHPFFPSLKNPSPFGYLWGCSCGANMLERGLFPCLPLTLVPPPSPLGFLPPHSHAVLVNPYPAHGSVWVLGAVHPPSWKLPCPSPSDISCPLVSTVLRAASPLPSQALRGCFSSRKLTNCSISHGPVPPSLFF